MVQVQLRLSEKTIAEIESWEFYELLNKRSKEAKKQQEKLIPLEEA
jgi:hypothetical protein